MPYILHFMTNLQIVVLMPLPLRPMSSGKRAEVGHHAAFPAKGVKVCVVGQVGATLGFSY